MNLQISEINNKEELSALIINELKDIGVKYRKDKKSKVVQEKTCRKRIFRTHLHLLELADVILANGGVVQIPKFVADACNRILEQVETEGIFRKAGSSIRQKEIRSNLEAGLPLGKSHHVIDVANVVKSFFRELPEPLIPTSMQETLLRGLLIGENHIKAILLTCLLLPPLTINTLSFFMQFLHTVALSSHMNKMPAENLAIIFTPGLMPFSDICSYRFNNHVKMVQLLIENANSIGTIPDCIIDKLVIHEVISNTPSKSRSFEALEVTQKKKKKRRSGSLTQMFNGLRKIVGSAIGSSENLESTPENKSTSSHPLTADHRQDLPIAATPCLLKSTKKRKFTEPVSAFSAKKKKDLLALLPNNSGGLLPNTPLTKENKKSRLSLGGRKHMKNLPTNPVVTSMERRWSIVGSGWSKNKIKNSVDIRTDRVCLETDINTGKSCSRRLSPVIAMPQVSKLVLPDTEFPVLDDVIFMDSSSTANSNTDFVRISKNEYEAIKERVAAIETRLSQEFNSLSRRSPLNLLDEPHQKLSGPERVVCKYEQMVEDTEALSSPTTEHLAQQLKRDLKIRRSSDHRVLRSPSARKIGTIRRRSQEKVRLSRNQTWHISSTANKAITLSKQPVSKADPPNYFYGKSNLKRGRPNTLHTGLLQQKSSSITELKLCEQESTFENSAQDDNWTDGLLFFNNDPLAPLANHQPNILLRDDGKNIKINHKFESVPGTPVKTKDVYKCSDNIKTPMLPPKTAPRKINNTRTPNSAMKVSTVSKVDRTGRIFMSTPNDEENNGRASIARLRTQNAGMVMAKAKLFDGLGSNSISGCETPPEQKPQFAINFHESRHFETSVHDVDKPKPVPKHVEKLKQTALSMSPNLDRKKTKTCSPGCIQKRPRLPLSTGYPDKRILDRLVLDLTQPRKLNGTTHNRNLANVKARGTASPSTPKNLKYLNINSPRRARNQGVLKGTSRIRTPLKPNAHTIQTHSPRVAKNKQCSRRAT